MLTQVIYILQHRVKKIQSELGIQIQADFEEAFSTQGGRVSGFTFIVDIPLLPTPIPLHVIHSLFIQTPLHIYIDIVVKIILLPMFDGL